MSAPSKAAHASSSNRTAAAPPRRFHSVDPYFGKDGKRQETDDAGFEAISGYKMPVLKKHRVKQNRHVSELTYASTVRGPRLQLQTEEAAAVQTRVTDTTLYPWRANAALKIIVPGKSDIFWGTGWFIGPYAVITAAHAVFPRETTAYTGWASQIAVLAGLNGSDQDPPYGSVISTHFVCPTGWQSDGDPSLDYGVVLLDQGLGLEVGTFGYATYSDDDLNSAVANLSGYPFLAPDGSPAEGTQWYGAGNLVNVDESFIYYDLQTQAGESGSCVYRNIGDQSYAMAIHCAGTPNNTLDRGLRIIEPVFQNLQQWASMRA